MTDLSHPAPHRDRAGFAVLLFGTCAAPIFWLGQLMLGYGVTAYTCYPGAHPETLADPGTLLSMLMVFDAVALAACVAGGTVSLWAWRQTRDESKGGPRHALHAGEGRTRFLALWGILSSLWFFLAILFNTIASLTVPPCVG
jgi:hypothetical protein